MKCLLFYLPLLFLLAQPNFDNLQVMLTASHLAGTNCCFVTLEILKNFINAFKWNSALEKCCQTCILQWYIYEAIEQPEFIERLFTAPEKLWN